MDLNIVSMGRLVEEQSFVSLRAPGHGHLWRDPATMKWIRLRVENFVPVLEPDPDQTGAMAFLEICTEPDSTLGQVVAEASDT
eukprot:3192905-Heterocapsa_arctica.AAC.1